MSFTTHRPSSIRLHLEGISEIDPIQPSLTLKPQMIDEEIQCDILDSKDIFLQGHYHKRMKKYQQAEMKIFMQKTTFLQKNQGALGLCNIFLFVKILKGLEILMKMKFY